MRASRFKIALVAASLTVTSTAHTQGADIEKAKALFNTGARAYDAGDFQTAIEAFEAANRVTPKPAIDFSLAQAERRQYFMDNDANHLRAAIDGYRKYVQETPPGQGRRADAAQALTEIVPIADKLAPTLGTTKEEVKHTKISVSSPSPAARISCDGSKPSEPDAPLTREVTPGKHVCMATAPGFVSARRDVVAVEGEFVATEISLAAMPAALVVEGADGASVVVDGRPAGTAGAAVSVAPGVHLVAIGKNGHSAYVREILFSPGEQKKLAVDLPTSTQRKIARAAIAFGAVGVLTGAACTVVALVEESRAKSVLDKQQTQNLSGPDLTTYDSARSARTAWTDAAIVSYAVGGAIAATGLVLYVFDAPSLTAATAAPDVAPPRPSRDRSLPEVGAVPVLAPGFTGGSVFVRF